MKEKPMAKTRNKKGSPSPIDIQIGANLRAIRNSRRISQDDLAKALGLTFQQIQKYERGTNRISAGRLCEIASFFGIPAQALLPAQYTGQEIDYAAAVAATTTIMDKAFKDIEATIKTAKKNYKV